MITQEDVEHVAELARLELTSAEKEQFIAQLNGILTYIEKLNELDTVDVEPTAQVIPISNVWRDDAVRPSLDRTKVLHNAPEESHFFFKVPRIIEE
ncbi:MAG TPA: Asp-tRNA(Asn)/Glu-tRNA(Gln) amidotransferase subunit GatC [Candidatus Tectomicrobia bacterium]